ncbi:MAG: hypothetical protein ACYDAR_15325 [Thermomicrobiales bacterium]
MSGPDYDALLRRRRIWGVPPDVVEHLAADCQREQTELRARAKELEGRLARANAERDEANQALAASRERIVRLEQENQEIANRPEMIREEAVRFVVDAWAEAQALREQTRQEIEEAETKAREEVAAIRRDGLEERRRHGDEMADERQRYETEIAALRERRQKAIVELESLAEDLLGQAARDIVPQPTASAPESAAPIAAESPPAMAEESHDQPHAPSPVVTAVPFPSSGPTEDRMLAKALDDLEAILSASRKANGA